MLAFQSVSAHPTYAPSTHSCAVHGTSGVAGRAHTMLFILHHEPNTAEWFPVSQAASLWCRDMQQPSPGALGSMCVCPYERHDMRKLRSNPK